MGARTALVALAAILAGAQVAPAANKEKLRAALVRPSLSIMMGFPCNSEGVMLSFGAEIDTGEEVADILAKAKAIEKAMTGDPRDAERYYELSKLYAKAEDAAKAKEVCDRAIALYRRRLEAEPDNGLVLVTLGELLSAADQIDESEKVLRRAVRVAPQEWRGWISLGQVLGDRAVELLAGKESAAAAHRKDRLYSLLTAGPPKAISPQQRELALKLLTEARACFDRAVTLAPQERCPHLARAAGCWRHAFLWPFLRPEGGQLPLDVNPFMGATAQALPDLKQVSQLSPKDYRALGAVAFSEMMIACADQKEKATDTDLPPLPDSARQSLRKSVKKLDKLAQGSDPRTAAGAEEVSGFLLMMGLKDYRAAEAHLRRSVLLRPSCEHAWDLLCAAAGGPQGTSAHLIEVCKDRLKHKDSARGHFLLAQAYEARDPEKCEVEVRAALKLEPDNYLANLALAVLLLRRQDDDAALAEASQVLAHHAKVYQKSLSREQWRDCMITWAICEGLKGNASEAKRVIKYVRDADPKNERSRLVSEALEE